MPMFSVSSMPFDRMRQIKKQTLQHGMREAKEMDRSSNWIAREVFPGDNSSSDFNDLDYATVPDKGSDFIGWVQDASDLTADELSSIFTNGEEVNENQLILWYGMFDGSPQFAEQSGDNTGEIPGYGPLDGIRFIRGSSDIEYWGTEHLYTSSSCIGFTDRIVKYLQQQNIDIQMNFTNSATNKFVGLRGYIFEKEGERMSTGWEDAWKGGRYIQPESWQWGVDPIQELTHKELWDKKKMIAHNLKQKLIDQGVANSPEDLVVREAVFGDKTNATDFVDFDYGTAAISGQENQLIANEDLTADQFSSILATGEQVPDNKAIGIYGFWDKDSNPSLRGIRFRDGSSDRTVYEPEHCYAYRDSYVEGVFQRPTYYAEKETFDPQVRFTDASVDHNVGFHVLLAERWSDTISKE